MLEDHHTVLRNIELFLRRVCVGHVSECGDNFFQLVVKWRPFCFLYECPYPSAHDFRFSGSYMSEKVRIVHVYPVRNPLILLLVRECDE